MIVWLAIVVACGAMAGFVRSAFRRDTNHRPRLLELVEAQERKQKQLAAPPTFEQKCLDVVREPRDIPMPHPPVSRMERTWNIPSGHAPSASDYARAVGMPVPMPIAGPGIKRKG